MSDGKPRVSRLGRAGSDSDQFGGADGENEAFIRTLKTGASFQ
jgi:hypothetical protein